MTLSDEGTAGDDVSSITRNGAEKIVFRSPSRSLVIQLDGGSSGSDSLNLQGLASNFAAVLTVAGDSRDIVNFKCQNTFTQGGDLGVTAGIINVDSNLVMSTRKISGSDHLTGASVANSGSLRLDAPQITVSSGAKLLSFADSSFSGGDLTLRAAVQDGPPDYVAAAQIQLTGATLKGRSISISATGSGMAATGITSNSNVSASVVVDSSTVESTNGSVAISASSTVSLTATGLPVPLMADVATVNGQSKAEVYVRGSSRITSASTLSIAATSSVTAVSKAAASNLGSPGVDAAVAVSEVTSTAIVGVGGTSVVSAAGAVNLVANNQVGVTTNADGSTVGSNAAGASAAVAVVHSTTKALVDGSASIAQSGSLSVLASSRNEVETDASSTPGGARTRSRPTARVG